jgi:predicted RNA-binding protein associated with RNAse of E/G family
MNAADELATAVKAGTIKPESFERTLRVVLSKPTFDEHREAFVGAAIEKHGISAQQNGG